jgi:L-threonylcarbamoyladenylate synthase
MRRLIVDPASPDTVAIAAAAAVLRAGGLVAFPTETVYGLGADALDPAAVRRIYEAKGRPAFNPIIVHVAGIDRARRLARHWPAHATRLAQRFWPGPLTLVVPKDIAVPDIVTAGLDAVGIRVPAHPVALALIRAADVPVAAPSANRFTQLSPTSADHVASALGDRIDVLLDGGSATVGIESTVVDLTGPVPRLLRPGMISIAALEEVVGPVQRDIAEPTGDAPRLSPGQVERHYAPRAVLQVLSRALFETLSEPHAADELRRLTHGSITYSDVRVPADSKVVRLPADADGYARGLYAALHQLDAAGCDRIMVELPPGGPEWNAVHDRLRRAAQ